MEITAQKKNCLNNSDIKTDENYKQIIHPTFTMETP